MSERRVVITGVGLASPIGHDLDSVAAALGSGRHGVRVMEDWSQIGELRTRLGAPALGLDFKRFPRKKARTMGRVGLLSAHATDAAVRDAGLDSETLSSGRTGLAYGSTHGSSVELEDFCSRLLSTRSLGGLSATSYLKFMSHTCAANLAQFFEIHGRIHSTVAACVSGSQAIGAGYETILLGRQDVMICGGAEELHFVHAAIFDLLYATSTRYNDRPELTPRPFDADRDGLVVGEGAGTLVLEDYERARRRGASIYAEVIGYGTNCDGTHVTAPSVTGMAGAMRLALEDAGVASEQIDYVNGHGTATEAGDIAESLATAQVLGSKVPISSTKGYTAHTLGACGAIEAIFCLAMMRDGFLAPSRNLDQPDPRCGEVDFIMGEPRAQAPKIVMSNNFAFGGINTSLILRRL
ncbi:MAG: beta-ketoacyl-ACP synthase [Myxococcales bacterium]|nr:beta-ketoacyl-ACP synthase [Myxococcales bacterium]